jgi:hypothetical protein
MGGEGLAAMLKRAFFPAAATCRTANPPPPDVSREQQSSAKMYLIRCAMGEAVIVEHGEMTSQVSGVWVGVRRYIVSRGKTRGTVTQAIFMRQSTVSHGRRRVGRRGDRLDAPRTRCRSRFLSNLIHDTGPEGPGTTRVRNRVVVQTGQGAWTDTERKARVLLCTMAERLRWPSGTSWSQRLAEPRSL